MCPCDVACMTVQLVENHMQSFFLCHFPARCARAHILPFSVVYYFFEYLEYFVVYKIHMQCCAERYSELRTQVSVANETLNRGAVTPTRAVHFSCILRILWFLNHMQCIRFNSSNAWFLFPYAPCLSWLKSHVKLKKANIQKEKG